MLTDLHLRWWGEGGGGGGGADKLSDKTTIKILILYRDQQYKNKMFSTSEPPVIIDKSHFSEDFHLIRSLNYKERICSQREQILSV